MPAQPGRLTVANFGQKPVLGPTPPTPPIMAQGGALPPTAENPASLTPEAEQQRRTIALSMLQQGQTGQPQSSAFAPAAPPPAAPPAPPPPDQAIAAAPPAAPIQKMPAPPPAAGVYTPPMPGTPQGAPIIGPTRREMELQTLLNANQTNPYATSSPAAIELKQLQDARTRRQTEADELFKAQVARDTKQVELHHTGRMNEQQREQELRKGRQELIDGGTAPAGAEDPRLLGTPQSPQRTGVPRPDPMPPGVIPQDWAKDQQKKMSAAADNLEAAKPELAEALDLMKKIRVHPGKDQSIGFGGAVGRMTPTGQGFAALDEQLKGKNLVAAYQKVRGTGPVGQVEGENIAKAQAALTTAATKEDYDAALNTLEGTMRGALERAERKMNRPVTAYQNSPDDPHAPDIGQPSPGGTKIYIGGDPAKPTSWKNR